MKEEIRHPSLFLLLWDCHSVEPLATTALIRGNVTEVDRVREKKEKMRLHFLKLVTEINPLTSSIFFSLRFGDCRLIT